MILYFFALNNIKINDLIFLIDFIKIIIMPGEKERILDIYFS
jgi:hypothetical protein